MHGIPWNMEELIRHCIRKIQFFIITLRSEEQTILGMEKEKTVPLHEKLMESLIFSER